MYIAIAIHNYVAYTCTNANHPVIPAPVKAILSCIICNDNQLRI